MVTRLHLFAAAAVVSVVMMLPARADAASLIVVTHGDAIANLGAIADPGVLGDSFPPGQAVGFKYSYVGLYWLDLWTWDGCFCIYKDLTYTEITAAQAAELMGTASVGVPWLYRLPPGLVVCMVGLVFWLLKKTRAGQPRTLGAARTSAP